MIGQAQNYDYAHRLCMPQFLHFAKYLGILSILNWVTLEYISSPCQHVMSFWPAPHVTVEEAHLQQMILLTQSSTFEPWIDTYRFSILHVRRGGTARNFTSRNHFTVGTLWGFTRSVEFDFPSPEKFDLFVEEKRTPTMYGLVFAQGENSP